MKRQCFPRILCLLLLLGSALTTEGSAPPRVRPPVFPANPGDRPVDDCVQLDSSRWVTESVDLSKTFLDMRDNSLALDAAGRPHVAYGGDHLYYAYYDGTGWHVETVDAGLQVGVYASLELDAAGRPHIAYYDQSQDTLRYAYYDGTNWQLQAVDVDDGMC